MPRCVTQGCIVDVKAEGVSVKFVVSQCNVERAMLGMDGFLSIPKRISQFIFLY